MRNKEIDLLVVSPSSNMYYLSNFTDEPGERLFMLLIPDKGDPEYLVPELYADQVNQQSHVENIRAWGDSDNPQRLLRSTLKKLEARNSKVAIDNTMWASFLLMLQGIIPNCNFVRASNIMSPLRRIKESNEISKMLEAGKLADEAFGEVSELSLKGMTELEIANQLEKEMLRRGGDQIAFETLVASGPNSALPHHRASKREIREGDTVIFDFGCKVNGYCSDTSRTVICGKPSPKQEEVYQVVREAQEKAFQAVEPGVEALKIDREAREYITKAGYGENFVHRTGHGIGLDVHEEPYIVGGNSLHIEEGMTFSIEPGIYLQEDFGVRIEDIVLVNKDGGKRLNNSNRELQ